MSLELDRVSGARLRQASLSLLPGLHVILGGASDGSLELLRMLAGDIAPKQGQLRIFGQDPYRTPELRRSLGTALGDSCFEENRVAQAVEHRFELKAIRETPQTAFARFDAAHLLDKKCATLARHEQVSVELVILLSMEAPKALFIHEPWFETDSMSKLALLDALGERATRAVVLCTTTHPRVAALLSSQALLLQDGRFVRGTLLATRPAFVAGLDRVRVECDDPQRLAAALSQHPAVASVHWDDAGAALVAEGTDTELLCQALLKTAVDLGLHVRLMSQVLPEPREIRMANAECLRAARSQGEAPRPAPRSRAQAEHAAGVGAAPQLGEVAMAPHAEASDAPPSGSRTP